MKITANMTDCKMIKKYAHAESCFKSCAAYLDIYLKEKVIWTSYKARALLSASIIEYAKPFQNSYGIEKISGNIIPQRYQKLHDLLIDSRNKYIAHLDVKGLQKRNGKDHEFHKVHILKRGNSVVTDVESPRFPPNVISDIKELALKLAKKSKYHKVKNLKKYEKKIFGCKGDMNWEVKIGKGFSGFIPKEKNDITSYNLEWEV